MKLNAGGLIVVFQKLKTYIFSHGTQKIQHCIVFSFLINWQNMVAYARHSDINIIIHFYCRITQMQVQLNFTRLKTSLVER